MSEPAECLQCRYDARLPPAERSTLFSHKRPVAARGPADLCGSVSAGAEQRLRADRLPWIRRSGWYSIRICGTGWCGSRVVDGGDRRAP